jgi:hypothetical protein
LDLVIPIWRHVLGGQIRQRFNLVSGSMEDLLLELADFGLNKNHVEVFFRSEMAHRQYVDKWLKSAEEEAREGGVGR